MADSGSSIPGERQYTQIFTLEDVNYGTIIVCVQGDHQDDDDFNPLPFDFHVFTDHHGVPTPLEDEVAVRSAVTIATLVYYTSESEIVSTTDTPIIADDERTATLTVPEFGTITAQCGGTVEVPGEGFNDEYDLFMANPSEGVYLLVILEIVGTNPVKYSPINPDDEDLVDAIIKAYLEDLGVTDPEEDVN